MVVNLVMADLWQIYFLGMPKFNVKSVYVHDYDDIHIHTTQYIPTLKPFQK